MHNNGEEYEYNEDDEDVEGSFNHGDLLAHIFGSENLRNDPNSIAISLSNVMLSEGENDDEGNDEGGWVTGEEDEEKNDLQD